MVHIIMVTSTALRETYTYYGTDSANGRHRDLQQGGFASPTRRSSARVFRPKGSHQGEDAIPPRHEAGMIDQRVSSADQRVDHSVKLSHAPCVSAACRVNLLACVPSRV